MKNLINKFGALALATFGALALVSCGGGTGSTTSEPTTTTTDPTTTTTVVTTTSTDDEPPSSEDVGFTIHFNKTDMVGTKYKYNLWLWEKGKDGGDYDFNGTDDYGMYAKYKFSDFSSTIFQSGIGFIVKENKPWSQNPVKDYDGDRFADFPNFKKDSKGYYQIYLKSGEKTVYFNKDGQIADAITNFSLAYNKNTGYQIWFQTNTDFSNYEIKKGNTVIFSKTVGADKIDASSTSKRLIFNLGNEMPDLLSSYDLKVTFKDSGNELTRTADTSILYDTIYSPTSTTFKVWSPVSSAIVLRVYNSGTPASMTNGSDEHTDYTMTKGEKGVFSATVNGDLEGKYYTYVVTNAAHTNAEVVDPYAKSTGINGLRGMVVDFSKTNPTGWDSVTLNHTNSQNLTVYETHIADYYSS